MLELLMVLAAGDPPAAEAAGRLDYVVARCAVFGWDADDAERMARFERLVADQPGISREEVAREFSHGTRYAFSREGEAIASVISPDSWDRWTRDTEALCDRTASKHPRLLRRTPETAERWATLLETEGF